MRAPLPVFVALCCCLPAQEPPIDLAPLRHAFDGGAAGALRVCIAFVPHAEPLCLLAGAAADAPVTIDSLVPLGATARLLIGDALLAAAVADEVDAVLPDLGGQPWTARMLLAGSERLPDWYALGPLPTVVDVAALIRCPALVDAGSVSFQTDVRGVAELELLAQAWFGASGSDWPAYARTRLSPRGAPIDPIDVRALTAEQRARVAAPPGSMAELAQSPAASLRLLASLRDVVAWWRWRLQQDLPLWTGRRAGHTAQVEGRASVQRWQWTVSHELFAWRIRAYPERRAARIEFALGAGAAEHDLDAIFEACLFGPAPPQGLRLGGGPVPKKPSLDRLRGVWVGVDRMPAKLEVHDLFGVGLRFGYAGEEFLLDELRGGDSGYRVTLKQQQGAARGELLLWHVAQPAGAAGGGGLERLAAVFVRRDARSAVPQPFELARMAGGSPRQR